MNSSTALMPRRNSSAKVANHPGGQAVQACPRCKSTGFTVSPIRSEWERLIRFVGMKIVCCKQCQTRTVWF